MDIVVIGLGSMGRRRIRLLQEIDPQLQIVGVDSKEERCEQAERELGIATQRELDAALRAYRPACAVIATAPLSHAALIKSCLQAGCHVFTELNLVRDGYEENMALAAQTGRVLFLSSPFLYREEIGYIARRLRETGEAVNYSYHVGQYLPDWHPWENINNFFVGDKRTNGCRELFSVELPWLTRVFGPVERFSVLSDKMSGLSVPYHDNYLLLLQHKGGNKGMLALDLVSRKAVRNLEVFGEQLYLRWNGTPDSLREYSPAEKTERTVSLYEQVVNREGYAAFVVENMFKKELECFLAAAKGEQRPVYGFAEDEPILALIDEIEKEAQL